MKSNSTAIIGVTLLTVASIMSEEAKAGVPSDDQTQQDPHAWHSDSTNGFPENTPLTSTGTWDKMMAAGGDPNYVWVWEDAQFKSADVSLRKISPTEGETLEEVAQLYSQGYGEGSEVVQTQLSENAILIEQTFPKGRGRSIALKIFQLGPDIWMLSGSCYGTDSSWEWCKATIPNYQPH